MELNNSFILPEWLDELSIDDSIVGQAYEATPAEIRASLKKTIACLACLYGEVPQERERKTRFNQGVTITERDSPISFCFIFCSVDYPYPERFIAALMPAIFSGVEYIIPCFIKDKEMQSFEETSIVSPPLLAAVDLAGVEFTYLIDSEGYNRLLLFAESQVSGHILELLKDKRMQRERTPHIPYTPLYVESDSESMVKSFQHKEEDFSPFITYPHGLSLHHTLKDIWVWQELTVSMFRKRSFSFE